METLIKSEIVLNISHIKKITGGDRECIVNVDTKECGNVDIYFEHIWDCRYCIENGGIVRWEKLIRSEGIEGSFFEVEESDYIKYFQLQTGGTIPVDSLTDYLMSDELDTIFEVLAFRRPKLVKEKRKHYS